MAIRFEKVGYSYKSFKTEYRALKDINLNIAEKDEFVAIVGHTGSGKSTLVQHMNALLLPTSGKVIVFGQDLPPKKREKINFLRKRVGLVFQFPEYQLFEETVIKDIAFGPLNFKIGKELAHQKALEAASKVGLDAELLEKSPFRISGGQMRRAAIAGILAMEPDILVLDEPTRGLDPQGQEDVMNIFHKLHTDENKTIVLITHDMDIISKYAKRIIVLNEGEIVFDGTKEELFNHPDFSKFHLDYPTPIKVLKHLEKTMNLKYEPKYSYDELLTYLREEYRDDE